jgi:hypothetical protein
VPDTIFNVTPFMDLNFDKDFLLEEGKIIDISRHTKKFDFVPQVCITRELYKELSPLGQEIQKGISFDERIEDMVKGFSNLPEKNKLSYHEFYLTYDSYLKEYLTPTKAKMYKTRRDRRIKLYATIIYDNQVPNILFGLSVKA